MPDVVSMSPEAMLAAAQTLQYRADELDAELEHAVHDWGELSATWRGEAAATFETPWDEWHVGAKMVAAILRERSQLLVTAVSQMVKHENAAAQALDSVADQGRSR